MSAFPTSPRPRTVQIASTAPSLMSEAPSGRQQVRTRGGQRWILTLNYPPRLRAELDPVFAAAAALQGRFNTCTVTPGYYHKDARGTATSGTASAGVAGAFTVSLSSLNGTLKAGDFLKFAAHSKVYIVTADKAAGAGALSISPALIQDVGSEALTLQDVPFTCRLAGDVATYGTGLAGINGLTVQLAEAY